MAPEQCRMCADGRVCINGRYCLKLKRYVEYVNRVPCAGKQQINNQRNEQQQ